LRPLAFAFTAARDGQALTVDRDCRLSYAVAHNKLVISNDPSSTIANVITTPPFGGQLPAIILVASAAGQTFVDFQLSNGEQIFLSAAGAGTSVLFFTDL